MDQVVKIEEDLFQIADMLLLNGNLKDCPGLVRGKDDHLVYGIYDIKEK